MGDSRKQSVGARGEKRKPIRRTRPLATQELLLEDIRSSPSSLPVAEPRSSLTPEMGSKSIRDKEKDKKKRGPTKERWLLTRKTWKYMADAGRRLIPEGSQNRPEDVHKIEEYFQQVCRSEPRFILCKRKCSYPGARVSFRRSKFRKSGPPKALRLGPEADEQSQNTDLIINMLKSYLNIGDEKKTTTLLGSQTFRPDQTESPSAQRPGSVQTSKSWFHITGSDAAKRANDISAQISELLERLRSYSQSCERFILSPDMITTDILEDKALLKRIYTELKKQQLHRILRQHPTGAPLLPHSSSLATLWHFRREPSKKDKQSSPPQDASEYARAPEIPEIRIKKPQPEKEFATLGTQTDFIPLHILQQMAKEYEIFKKEEERMSKQTDDEAEKPPTTSFSRRKSSIDNEDVSQSVSDTIKRYLRMARKKSVQDDQADRFRRVNYDRYLRNIRAKNEINPPGMDEGPNKATQTLDAWPVLALGHIRGIDNTKILEESHADWQSSLQRRIQQKEQYEQQLKQQQKEYEKSSGHSTSPPSTHPSGLFHSGTQFLSNLWHGHHSAHDSTARSSPEKSGNVKVDQLSAQQPTMQKSKSSSNVGQFVSKKIWRSRSKSQTRTSSPTKPEWTPQGNCIWTSASGKRLILSDTKLQDLTEIERKILHRVAIEKINQLNIGVNVTAPGESANASSKPQKRRPLLIKRKALTTGFFDAGKKGDNKEGGGLVFGVSLEKCVDNDQKIHKDTSDRGSRNSIISLFSGSKAGDNIGSCESLPSKTQFLGQTDNGGGLMNSAAAQMSRSQSDIRRVGQEEDELGVSSAPPMACIDRNNTEQVPALVTACIKHLEEHGLHTVGIFRVSTSKKRVRQLKEDFDRGEITTLDPEMCPHDVATILKEYLRDLPEPLICRNLYKAFVKTQKIRNRRLQLEALAHLVQLLPVAHRDTLYALLKFLAKIVRSSDDVTSRDGTILSAGNKMDSNNLATIFAPNILRYSVPGQSATEQEIDDQIDVINVIRTMIDHYEELFKVPAELLDEVYTNMIDTFPQQLDYLCERRDTAGRYDDDMESGASSSAMSSPPSTQATIDSEKQQVLPDQTESTPRRIYSREDFLHENAAKGDPNGNGVAARRRERVSKMKYVENEHDIVRRRRRERHWGESAISNFSSASTARQQSSQNIGFNGTSSTGPSADEPHSITPMVAQSQSRSSSSETTVRRLSSPYVLHSTGVVTATLKIPVQMQATTSTQQHGTEYSRSSTQLDLSDIPYIEDVESQYKQAPVTGSLSFGNLKESTASNTYQIPISYEGRLLNSPSGSSSTSPESTKPSPFSTGSSSSIFSITPKRSDSIKRTSRKHSTTGVAMSRVKSSGELISTSTIRQLETGPAGYTVTGATQIHIEPKITPSITKIGGAVLRSKTADFERMLMQNKKHKTSDADEVSRVPGTPSVSDSVPESNEAADKTRRSSQGPIYKRQELISSAKRSSK